MIGIAIALIVISLIITIASALNEDGEGFLRGIAAAIFVIAGISMLIDQFDKTPKAIDVYRGNTEMVIQPRIENNQVVGNDTIIIWKNTY